MKKIQLKSHRIKRLGDDGILVLTDYKESEYLYTISRAGRSPDKRFTYDDMVKFGRIDAALAESDKNKNLLELDNADFDFFKAQLKGNGFFDASKDIVKIHISLVERFEKASEEKEEKKEKEGKKE